MSHTIPDLDWIVVRRAAGELGRQHVHGYRLLLVRRECQKIPRRCLQPLQANLGPAGDDERRKSFSNSALTLKSTRRESLSPARFFSRRLIALLKDTVELIKIDRLRSEEHTSELQSRRDLVCRP